MNVLIVEDEVLAAERLESLLVECLPHARIVDSIDSVKDVITFFSTPQNVDLMLLDIELADGKSFEIFKKVSVDIPVIFTTAYDQFAIQAFKFHSIDYLLKPIQKEELKSALDKFEKLSGQRSMMHQELSALKEMLFPTLKKYKERFIIKSGNKLQYKTAIEAAYFFADGKETFLVTRKENRKYIIDHTLEELESLLDPKHFFRISRKYFINIESISEVKGLISTRLEVKLNIPCDHDLSVSRDRAQEFKNWLDR